MSAIDQLAQLEPDAQKVISRAVEVVRFSHVANRRRCLLGTVYAYPIPGGKVGCQVLSKDGMPIAQGIR